MRTLVESLEPAAPPEPALIKLCLFLAASAVIPLVGRGRGCKPVEGAVVLLLTLDAVREAL